MHLQSLTRSSCPQDEADRLETALEERQQAELAERSMADFGVSSEQPAPEEQPDLEAAKVGNLDSAPARSLQMQHASPFCAGRA